MPYDIVNQDIEDNINSMSVTSIYSITKKYVHNLGINNVEPISVQSTLAKMTMLDSNPEFQVPVIYIYIYGVKW